MEVEKYEKQSYQMLDLKSLHTWLIIQYLARLKNCQVNEVEKLTTVAILDLSKANDKYYFRICDRLRHWKTR